MHTYLLQSTGIRQKALWSVALALILLIALCASLSLGEPAMAAPVPTHPLPAQFSTGEVSTTYLITGQVRPAGGFTDLSRAIIYAGSQYSATLDPDGFYTMTGVVSGTYEITGEIPSPSPCTFFYSSLSHEV